MRQQPEHTNRLTKEFFEKYHLDEKRSMSDISRMLKQDYNINIAVSTLCKYCDRVGIPRRKSSEAKRNLDLDPLDWNKSFETPETIEMLDGFLLGDGHISPANNQLSARLSCTQEHQEFALYQIGFFNNYKPYCEKYLHKKSKNHSSGYYWDAKTKYHPDLYKHYLRWYSPLQEGLKEPPLDVQITPKSVMIWYLGDGSYVEDGGSVQLRLSTDGFSPKGVEFLAGKLKEGAGIACHRNNDNRIYIEAKGIPAFFAFIGKESPVKCYEYKFKAPEWRMESKRMMEVANELNVDYGRLHQLYREGRVKAHKISENGKPRFLPEHVEAVKAMIASGEFHQDRRKDKKS